MSFEEREISIGEVKNLLDHGYEIEVDSPDGYVPISLFVDKGEWDEYLLELSDGRTVRVNENHLFETNEGWRYAKNLCVRNTLSADDLLLFICDDGLKRGKVIKTGSRIPIVDIQVNHENHRYYTNGVSSHNTGVGKSLFMCHCAAANLTRGNNVLYITLEMAEEKIAERIDANLLNVTVDELAMLPKDAYDKKIERVRGKTTGKLIIKEYPTATAGSANFRHLFNELKIKKGFVPDIVYIDYLNICNSSRMKQGGSVNSYTYIKAIAEELRGLAVEQNVPIISATQTTRSGFCLALDTKVETKDRGICNIANLNVGDNIRCNTGWNMVTRIFPVEKKQVYKITTHSGKTIICSADHIFPTSEGEKSISRGLIVGDKLMSKPCE